MCLQRILRKMFTKSIGREWEMAEKMRRVECEEMWKQNQENSLSRTKEENISRVK